MERFLLIGITQDLKSALEYVGDDIVMKEFAEDNHTRSHDNDLREAYNKEEALKEQFFADGQREGIKEGIEQGKKEGIEQGKKNRTIDIASNMLKEEIDISTISKVTSLSIEEINKL